MAATLGAGQHGGWHGVGLALAIVGATGPTSGLPVAAAPLEVITRPAVPADVGASSSWTSFRHRSVSDDGRWVVFHSAAANLVSGLVDDNERNDVFVRDTASGVTQLVSRNAGGTGPAAGDSVDAMISADGSTVAFYSDAADLVAGQSGAPGNLFVWYRPTGELQMASSLPGASADGCGCLPSEALYRALSDDGRYLVFVAEARLTAMDPGPPGQVYRFDRMTGERLLVSHAAGDPARGGNDVSTWVDVSADGQVVVFTSRATDLVAGLTDTAATPDVFAWSSASGATELLSHAAGTPSVAVGAQGGTSGPQVSDDGRWVLFASQAPNLLAGLTPPPVAGLSDLYLRDRTHGTVQLVSHAAGSPAVRAGITVEYALAAAGRFVAFTSRSKTLVPGQVGPATNWDVGLYRWDRDTDTTVVVNHRHDALTTLAAGSSSKPRLSADGRWVSFTGWGANDLVAGSSGPPIEAPAGQLYLFDGDSGAVALVSAVEGEAPRFGLSQIYRHWLSGDGEVLVFSSLDGRLDPAAVDPSGVHNVYQYRRSAGGNELVSRRAPELVPATATAGDGSCTGCVRVGPGGVRLALAAFSADLVPQPYGYLGAPTGIVVVDRGSGEVQLLNQGEPSGAWWPYTFGMTGSQQFAGEAAVVWADSGEDLREAPPPGGGFFRSLYRFDLDRGERTLVTHAEGAPHEADGDWGELAVARGGATALAIRDGTPRVITLLDLSTGQRTLLATAIGDGWDGTDPGLGLSADGRLALFLSADDDLVPGQQDVAGTVDAFVYDRTLASFTLVSHVAGQPLHAAGGVLEAVLSDDGSHVAFISAASNLVAGQVDAGGSADVFLASLAEGKSELVTHGGDRITAVGAGAPGELAIDAEGRHVAYTSAAALVVPGLVDGNGARDVFRYRRRTRSNELISHRAGAPLIAANGASSTPALASDGETIAFVSTADDLVVGQIDDPGVTDVFVFEGRRGRTRLASFAGDPLRAGNGDAHSPVLSPEGGVLVLSSWAPLVPGDYNAREDVFLMRVIELHTKPWFPAELSEPDESARIYLRASHLPSGTVHVALRSTTPSACTVTPAEVVLDAANWAQGVAVTVTAVDDNLIDGPESCHLEIAPATGDDLNLVGFDLADVTITVRDDDAAGDALLSDDFEDGSAFAWAQPGTL